MDKITAYTEMNKRCAELCLLFSELPKNRVDTALIRLLDDYTSIKNIELSAFMLDVYYRIRKNREGGYEYK